MQQADKYREEGELFKAFDLYKALLETNPDNTICKAYVENIIRDLSKPKPSPSLRLYMGCMFFLGSAGALALGHVDVSMLQILGFSFATTYIAIVGVTNHSNNNGLQSVLLSMYMKQAYRNTADGMTLFADPENMESAEDVGKLLEKSDPDFDDQGYFSGIENIKL